MATGARGLAVAVQAVAAADFEVKGGGRDPVYAVGRILYHHQGARRPLTAEAQRRARGPAWPAAVTQPSGIR